MLTPDEVANRYSLDEEEATILTLAQCWMMVEDSERKTGQESKQADSRDFFRIAAERIGSLSTSEVPWLAALGTEVRTASSEDRSRMLASKSQLDVACSRSRYRSRSLLLLIELAGFHPWSPKNSAKPARTAVPWHERTRRNSLDEIAEILKGTRADDAVKILRQYRAKSQVMSRGQKWTMVGLVGTAGLGVGILTAGLAAPAIGGFIGTTVFGLSGAAATSAGLAALGGGALAAGGFGMAGGTALIAGVGGLVAGGLLGGSAKKAGDQLDRDKNLLGQLVADAIKLQVTARVIVIDELGDVEQIGAIVEGLERRRDELDSAIVTSERSLLEAKKSKNSDAENGLKGDLKTEIKMIKSARKMLQRNIDELIEWSTKTTSGRRG